MRVDVYFKMSIENECGDDPKRLMNMVNSMTDSDFRAKCKVDRADVFKGAKSCSNCMFSDIIEVNNGDGKQIADCVFKQGIMDDEWESTACNCCYYEPCPDVVINRRDLE